jgi:hypothetical protein
VDDNGTVSTLLPAGARPDTPTPRPPGGPDPVAGPRMPKRTLWVDLPETTPDGDVAYPGFKVRVWVNFPARFAEQLKTGTEEEKAGVLRRIIVEHNGWCDDEGHPFPAADDPAFYQELPQELASLILYSIVEAMNRFPNSLLRMRAPSGAT